MSPPSGLQIVPDWVNYFNHPSGKALGACCLSQLGVYLNVSSLCLAGLINCAQNVGAFLVSLPFNPAARMFAPYLLIPGNAIHSTRLR